MNVKSKAVCGAIGAIAPDIVLFYSKRWTMPSLKFDPYMYVAASVLYVGLAAFVAAIYPYRKEASAWKAFGIGVALPTIISVLASINRAQVLVSKGPATGSFRDLLAWF